MIRPGAGLRQRQDRRCRRFSFALIAMAAIFGAHGAAAQNICASVVNGELVRIDRETFLKDGEQAGRRERLLTWPGRRIDALRDRDPECDSRTLIIFLGQQVPADDIDGYCLSEQAEDGFLLVPGTRNYRGRCSATACERVNATKDTSLAVGSAAARAIADTALGTGPDRSLLHSSGAAILTGSGSYIASTLGTIGSSLATALSAPAVLAATAVTVVAVGSAVYVCSE